MIAFQHCLYYYYRMFVEGRVGCLPVRAFHGSHTKKILVSHLSMEGGSFQRHHGNLYWLEHLDSIVDSSKSTL